MEYYIELTSKSGKKDLSPAKKYEDAVAGFNKLSNTPLIGEFYTEIKLLKNEEIILQKTF